jgi:shikimate dehydrogenase
MAMSGAARLAGVVGWPVSHSLSPRLHGHWFERYGVDGAYVPLAVRPEDLGLAFQALPRLGFRGWNVTVPHKEHACRLVDRLDPTAAKIGAVNTVVCEDGRTLGLNTDGLGFVANLRQQAPDWRADRGPALLLGAGGAARGVAATLLAQGVPKVWLVNRTEQRAALLAQELTASSGAVEALPWSGVGEALADTALLVNCTSLGMTGQPPLEVPLASLPTAAVVADLVYAPLETALLAAARARGNVAVEGLGMLLHQAVPGFTHWGGVVPEVDAELRAAVLSG